MKIVGWPSYVNLKVLEDTTINIGEGGYVEDSNSNGYKDRRLTSLAVPDKFNVVMDFDWRVEDEDGLTEYDRFVRWYKFVHKRGVNPFYFPCITRHPVTNLITTDESKSCLYKITSALTPQKSGYSMRITMSWEEVYDGIISVTEHPVDIDRIDATSSRIRVYYTPRLPDNYPTNNSVKIHYKKSSETDWSETTLAPTLIRQKDDYLLIEYDGSSFESETSYDVCITYSTVTSPTDTFIA